MFCAGPAFFWAAHCLLAKMTVLSHTWDTWSQSTSVWLFHYVHFHLFLPSEEVKVLNIQMLQKPHQRESHTGQNDCCKLWSIKGNSVLHLSVGIWWFSLALLANILNFPPSLTSPGTHPPSFCHFMAWTLAQRKPFLYSTVQWVQRKVQRTPQYRHPVEEILFSDGWRTGSSKTRRFGVSWPAIPTSPEHLSHSDDNIKLEDKKIHLGDDRQHLPAEPVSQNTIT